MSLLLCRQENVRRPYYMEVLGVHLYSSQELAYVIFNHPLLVMDGFIDDNLLDFLRDELGQGFLALKIERYISGGGSTDDVLPMILSESDYYSGTEITKYRALIKNFRNRHPAEYGKVKADELFSMKQYHRAVDIYLELLERPRDKYVDDSFIGKIWYNLGICYARMFQMEKAMESFERSYLRNSQKAALEQMVILTQLDSRLILGDRIRALIDDETIDACQEKVAAAHDRAQQTAKLQEIEELFARDSLRRREGERLLISEWKNEYRCQQG